MQGAHDTIGAIKADAITGIERAAEFSALKDASISALNGLNEPWWKAVLLSRKMTPSSRFARFEEAADLQDSLPYTEPPYWYYPLRKTLAAALVHASRLDEAEDRFLHGSNGHQTMVGRTMATSSFTRPGERGCRSRSRGQARENLDRRPRTAAALEALAADELSRLRSAVSGCQ